MVLIHRPSVEHLRARWLMVVVGVIVACWSVGALGFAAPLGPGVVRAADGRPPLDEPGVPVRIQLANLGIDLPVVSSERTVPGNSRDYPLCDVAQYWTIYDLPGEPGTTWIYAHAQPGMFLPLFLTADATRGLGLLGRVVTLQLRDGRLLRYRIDEVKQHALNRRIAFRDRPGQHRLVLQTSEGPPGTIPKLQVAARLVAADWTDEKPPVARPRACWQPRVAVAGATTATSGRNGDRPGDRERPGGGSDRAGEPTDSEAGPVDGGTDVTSLALGGGVVLLGALLLAVYLVRRPPPARPDQRRPPSGPRRPSGLPPT